MSTATRKRYLVNLVTWESYVQWFEAESAEHAIELAEEDYSNNGDANFHGKGGGIECCDICNEEDVLDGSSSP
jgi:hypothetical protein